MKRFPVAILLAAALSACPKKTEPPREEPKKPAPVQAAPVARDISIRLLWPAESLTLSPGETRSWEVEIGEKAVGTSVRLDEPLSATLKRASEETGIRRIKNGESSPFSQFVNGGASAEILVLTLAAPASGTAGTLTGEVTASGSGGTGRLAFTVRVAPMDVRVREAVAGATEPLAILPLGRLLSDPGFDREGSATVDFADGIDATGAIHFGRFAMHGSTLLDLARLEVLGPLVDTSRFPGFTALELAGPPTRMKLLVFSHERVDFVDLAQFPAAHGFALPGDCAVSFRGERVARISADGTQALACNAAGKLTWHRGLDAKEPAQAVTVLEAGVENVWADAAFEHAVALFREPDGKSTLKAFAISDPPGLRDLPGSLISIREAWFCPESGLLLVAGPNGRVNSAALYDVAHGELRAALPETEWGRPIGFLRNSGLPAFDSSDGFSEWDPDGGPPRRLRWTRLPPGFALPGTEVRCSIEGAVAKFARPN